MEVWPLENCHGSPEAALQTAVGWALADEAVSHPDVAVLRSLAVQAREQDEFAPELWAAQAW